MDKLTHSMLQFSEACISTRTVAEVSELVERVVVSLGVERFAMAGLPLPHESLASYFHLNGWPEGWFDRYVRKNYFRDDPVVNLVRRADRTIVWSEAIDNHALAPKARQVMREAADFGMRDGITIPIFTRSGFAGIFSVAGKKVSLSAAQKDLLHIVAIRTYTRVRDLSTAGSDITEDIMITRSESECLTWCVQGKKDREIGEMTRRSTRTVQTHLSNLQQKLNAKNRAHLIAEAFRRGLQR